MSSVFLKYELTKKTRPLKSYVSQSCSYQTTGCSTIHSDCHHCNQLGCWNSSTRRQLCTHRRLPLGLPPRIHTTRPPPVWLVRRPPSPSWHTAEVQIHSLPMCVLDCLHCCVDRRVRFPYVYG